MKVILQAHCALCKKLLLDTTVETMQSTRVIDIKCDEHPNHKFTLTPTVTD